VARRRVVRRAGAGPQRSLRARRAFDDFARAALREFYSLSPLWLRAGAAAALLVVCGLAALSLARTQISWDADGFAFSTGVPERVTTKIEKVAVAAPAGLDEAQVEAVVRERVRAELAARRVEEQVAADDAANAKPAPRLEEAASTPRRKRVAPRTTTRTRRQLEDDESLPRLSDLLSGVY
jgi:membrane-bound lytic murein transglycosylase B